MKSISGKSKSSKASGMEEFSRYDDKYWSSLLHDDYEMGASLKKKTPKHSGSNNNSSNLHIKGHRHRRHAFDDNDDKDPKSDGIADLIESHTVEFDLWSQYHEYDFGEPVVCNPFSICGTEWQLQVCPKGFDDHFGTSEEVKVSCHLKHCGSKPVRCRYTLTLIHASREDKNITWTDEEGVVSFGVADSGSDIWGTEEFFPLSLLASDGYGYLRADILAINVDMEIYGDVHIDSHPLTKAIENTSAELDDLKALAVSELSLITKTLPGSKNCLKAGEEFKYQDKIVKSRVPAHKGRHY
jgi:hypothetical protein